MKWQGSCNQRSKEWHDAAIQVLYHLTFDSVACVRKCVYTCLQVDEQQLKKQLEEITVIIKVRETLNTTFPVSHTLSRKNTPVLFSHVYACRCVLQLDINAFCYLLP